MSQIINVSKPSKLQVVHSIERVLGVFLVSGLGVWIATPNPFSKSAAYAAVFAGITAVYQALLSLGTSL